MEKKIYFSKISIIIITIFFIVISGLISWYVATVDDEVLEVTRVNMENISVEMGLEIERSIEESEDDLSLLSEYAANADIHSDNAVDFLASQSQVEEFEFLYYIDQNGNGINLENKEFDFSQNKSFLQAMQNTFEISEPHYSTLTGELIFDVAVPIIQNDVVTGVLLSEVLVHDLYEIMDATAKSGWIFIVDYDLNILFTSSVGHVSLDSIPPNDIETLGIENVSKGVTEAKAGNYGSFTYSADYGSGNTQKILTYVPIGMTEWVLAVAIEENAINVNLASSVNQITTVSLLILIITMFFVVYIWAYRQFTVRSLERTAYYDKLTDLPNLTKLKKDMAEILTKNKDKSYSVVKIDIENFKAINEMFGFEIGNRVLQAFKPIRETVPETTLQIARTGIDEFTLFSGNGFLNDMENRTSVYESYYQKFIPELGNYNIQFKYGRYHIPIGYTDVDEIINRLNLAHRISKESKGLIIYDYDESYSKKLLKEAEIASKMHDALKNNEFEIYLQPKFRLIDNKLVGAEALVRWRESDGNMIFPSDFIPFFEKNGFIVELDKYVLNKACELIKKWIDENKKPIAVSVNCSRQNLNSPNLVEDIGKIADSINVPHELLEIELTESATIENPTLITQLFSDLRNSGFKISIDDFGAGYSSLGLLKDLKADSLKLDKSFFDEEEKEVVRAEYVVGSFIKLSHNLEMHVVAEGIEKEEQILQLKKLDCDAVQGYYYSKPIPIGEFEEKYKKFLG